MNLKPTSLLMLILLVYSNISASSGDPDISFTNYFDVPCYAASIEFDANSIYEYTGIGHGTPLKIVTNEGKTIPVYPSGDYKKVYVHLSLGPGETMAGKIITGDKWRGFEDYMKGDWNAEEGIGRISNGIVSAEYGNTGINILYINPLTGERSADIVNDLIHNAWIDDTLSGLMHVEMAAKTGLTKFDMLKAEIVDAEASVSAEFVRLKVIKRCNEVLAEDILVEEVLTLHAHQPVCEYAVTLKNIGERVLYLGNVIREETDINGKYGEHVKSDRIILERHSVTQEGIPHFIPPVKILEEGYSTMDMVMAWTYKGWGDKFSYVENPRGYGLGICLLKKQQFDDQEMRWITWTDAFSVPSSTEYSTVPAELVKGRPAEMGIAVVPFQPGTPGYEQTREIYHAIMDGQAYRFKPGISVILGGVSVCGPELLNFNGIRQELWAGSSGSMESTPEGIRLKAGKEGGNAGFVCELNMDEKPVLSLELASVSKKAEFSLLISQTGKTAESFELLASAEPVTKAINLMELTGWDGRQEVVLEISCKGKKGSYADLSELRISPSAVAAPAPLYPYPGMDITDIATSFSWRILNGMMDYEIQVADNNNFTAPHIYERALKTGREGSRASWFSHKMLEPGTWYWRIRAISPRGTEGNWSEPVSFTVNNVHPKRPLVREITGENPLFVIDAWGAGDLANFEDKIPSDLKPNIAVNWPSVHDYYSTPSPDGKKKELLIFHNVRASLCHMEEIFRSSENILGLEYGEEPGDFERLQRMIKICAKYGRYLIFADAHWTRYNRWQKFFSDPEFSAFAKEYSDYVRLVHKTNRPHMSYISMGMTLGGWMDGQTGGNGMHMEGGWYWDEAGFDYNLDEHYGWRGGDKHAQPPNFWNLNAIVAITQGASVVFYAGQENATMLKYDPGIHKEFWKEPHHGTAPDNVRYQQFWDSRGNVTPVTDWFLWPFLRAVISRDMVPTEEEVRSKIKATVYLDEMPDPGESYDWSFGRYDTLFRNTYGIRKDGEVYELIPNNGRYFWIPIMPYGSEGMSGKVNLTLSELQDEENVRKVFDNLYPERSRGGAWVSIIGDKFYILSGHENRSDVESYDFALGRSGIRNISGEIGAHKYIIGRTYDDGKSLWIQANTEYIEDDTEMEFKCESNPSVKVNPEDAIISSNWDPVKRLFRIRLSHKNGAVDLELQ